MYRVLLSLLLITSLLAAVIAPCCVKAAEGAAPETAVETGHHCGGESNSTAPEADGDEPCKDCVHCLQPASPLRTALVLGAALMPIDVQALPVAAAPIKPQAPPLRPPIQFREQA